MLTQLFQFDIRLEVVVRRPLHNVYDGRDTMCTTVVIQCVRRSWYMLYGERRTITNSL